MNYRAGTGMVALEGRGRIVTSNFSALFVSVLLMFFALDFFVPVMPFYVLLAGGSEAAVGSLMGVFTLCAVVLRPFQGRTLNQRGRRKLLVGGIALYTVAGLGLILMPTLPLLFLFRALQGFGWGSFLLAFNTLALDLAPPGRSGEALGLIGIAPPLSLASAPLLGEYLRVSAAWPYPWLFLLACTVSLLALAAAVLVREPAPASKTRLQQELLSRKVLLPSVIIFFVTFNLGGILTFLPLLDEARNIGAAGIFFAVFALTAVVFRPLAGGLSDRIGRPRVFIPGLFIAASSLALIAYAASASQLLLGGFLFGVGLGASHSSVLAMAADRLPPLERGVGMATFTTAFDMGIVAGSVVLGLLLGRFTFTTVFLLCALMLLVPVFIYLYRFRLRAGRVR